VQKNYDFYFVLGKRGRFGTSFSGLLRDSSFKVFEFGSAELDEALRCLILKLKDGARICIIWCLGGGNSAGVLIQNRELNLLKQFYLGLEAERAPLTNSSFIYLSTGGKMYGFNTGRVNESSAICPTGMYGMQKRECELLIQQVTPRLFCSSIIFRIANAYSFQRLIKEPKGFVENCLWAIESGQQLNFTANPLSRRQYGSHSDYSRVLLKSIELMSTDSDHKIYNIAPSFTYNLYEIINIFQTHFGKMLGVNEYEFDNLVEDTLILESKIEEACGFKYEWNTIQTNLQNL
jgi:nucleoside-diphosphate-sugar epimerase